eukprot:CAMPEP_0117650522 /NCGR_PEP_ID=MMETSP0804-20121206/1584_1 /TAXON_ID=1074897 /ORGANISM="Tetraselmis astigmatica, Strain CCMP880" /LENGTH=459 /DNA_ID=CAMNT_0005456399 /DNA_START=231 /DNA_END=1611 /DNA_ORIENTATION=+
MAGPDGKHRESKKEYLQRKRQEKQAKLRARDEAMDWTRRSAAAPPDQPPQHQGHGGEKRQPPAQNPLLLENIQPAPGQVEVHGKDGLVASRLPRCQLSEMGWAAGGAAPIPTRPDWKGVASGAEELDALEVEAFEKWERGLQELSESSGLQLSWYERRLGFWRQLWRVMERSHVLLLVVDVRFPLYHLHPGMLSAAKSAGLPLVVVLNKEDLVPEPAAAAWREYLNQMLAPQVRVVSAQARTIPQKRGQHAEANWEAARVIYETLLEVEVKTAGSSCSTSSRRLKDIVGCDADEIVCRVYGAGPKALLESRRHQRGGAAAMGQACDGATEAVTRLAGSDDSGDWDLKGTKARKKAAHRRRRGGHGPPQEKGGPSYGKGGPGEGHSTSDDTSCSEQGGESSSDSDSTEHGAAAGAEGAIKDGVVVVGILGEPNVGKSSTVNALLGAHKGGGPRLLLLAFC